MEHENDNMSEASYKLTEKLAIDCSNPSYELTWIKRVWSCSFVWMKRCGMNILDSGKWHIFAENEMFRDQSFTACSSDAKFVVFGMWTSGVM